MAQRVLDEKYRAVAQPVANQVFLNKVLESTDALPPLLLQIVVVSLKLPSALLFGFSRDRLQCRFGRLPNQPSCEVKFVSPDLTPPERCHGPLPSLLLRTAALVAMEIEAGERLGQAWPSAPSERKPGGFQKADGGAPDSCVAMGYSKHSDGVWAQNWAQCLDLRFPLTLPVPYLLEKNGS